MFLKLSLISLFVGICISEELPTLYEYYTKGGIKSGLDANGTPGNQFKLNGRDFTLIGGSFHYFRIHESKWNETLLKFKAAGLNTVDFYTIWNLHEEHPGQFDFETGMLNIKQFLTLIKQNDMFAMIRPGPFICAEWEFGGMPGWLLRDPDMKVRSNYKPFMAAVDKYFSKLYEVVKEFQFATNGGPIIAIQLEDEFASYGSTEKSGDKEYIKGIGDMTIKYGMKDSLLFTSDTSATKEGTIEGMFLNTINFNEKPKEVLNELKKMQPDKVLFVPEYWPGWMDNWGAPHHKVPVENLVRDYTDILFTMNASVNLYMFIGGTNWGFMAGAGINWGVSSTGGIITSYDYDAPLDESGNYTEKYWKVTEIVQKFKDERNLPKLWKPEAPDHPMAAAYGRIEMKEQLRLSQVLKHVKPQESENPIFMESLDIGPNYGQNFGYTLYRTVIPVINEFNFTKGNVNDRGYAIVDDNQIAFLTWKNHNYAVPIEERVFNKGAKEHYLDILVESMSRQNWGTPLNTQRKGMQEDIIINDKVHKKWQIFPLEFKPDFLKKISEDKWEPIDTYRSPTLYRAFLDIDDEPRDTFVKLDGAEGWTYNIVIINGFVLGRWASEGPQRALYLPGALLYKGKNEIIIFETQGNGGYIEFIDRPDLGPTSF